MKRSGIVLGAVAGLSALAAAPAAGEPERARKSSAEPAVLKQIADCRAVDDASARLKCYDDAAAALGQALAAKDLYVVEKQEVRETRRSLFGFSLPRLGLFGDANDDENRLDQIESTVAAASEGGDGNWLVSLADGSVWQQVDGKPIALPPERGGAITVKRAALGAYTMRVGNQPGVKVKRLR